MSEEETTQPKEENKKKDNIRIPFTGVMEILASKISRKATIVAMAMVLIYLLAATPNVAQVLFFIGAIAGLAVFFTLLQWILDIKDDRKDRGSRGRHKDPPGDNQ